MSAGAGLLGRGPGRSNPRRSRAGSPDTKKEFDIVMFLEGK